MLITLVGILFLLGGVFGAVLEFRGLYLVGYFASSYSIELLLRLAFDGLCIGLGIGLLRRWETARGFAIGFFLLGSLTFLIVPLIFYLSGGAGAAATLLALMFLGYLPPGPKILESLPSLAISAAALVIVPSVLSFWLFRYFRRDEVASKFHRGKEKAAFAVAGRGLYVTTAIWAVLTFTPVLIHSMQQRLKEAERETNAREQAALNLVKQVQLDRAGKSLLVASGEGNAELRMADLASGTVVRKDPAVYGMTGSGMTHIPEDRLSALVSDDNLLFLSRRTQGAGVVQLASDEERPLSSLQRPGLLVPLGFREGSRFLLVYTGLFVSREGHLEGGKLELIDVDNDRILYSTAPSRPEWLSGSDGANILPRAVHEGGFSPDRKRFAYLYKGRLHVLDAEAGALDIVERDLGELDALHFSVEGDAVLVHRRFPRGTGAPPPPGMIYNVAARTMMEHPLHTRVFHFSSATATVIAEHGRGAAEFRLADSSAPRWYIELADRRTALAANADAAYLFLKNHTDNRFEFVDLRRVRAGEPAAFAPLPTRTKIRELGSSALLIANSLVIAVNSPDVELIPMERLESKEPASLLVNFAKPVRR